jgi:hypothetical protein
MVSSRRVLYTILYVDFIFVFVFAAKSDVIIKIVEDGEELLENEVTRKREDSEFNNQISFEMKKMVNR